MRDCYLYDGMAMKADLCAVYLHTPIGNITVIHSPKGVREIKLDNEYNSNEKLTKSNFEDLTVTVKHKDGPWFASADQTLQWLTAFFSSTKNNVKSSTLPEIDNDIFTRDNFIGKVLRTLAHDVGRGETISYAGLAKLCGSPKACRAVGQAMRANPVPLIVPCHRVVGSNGKLGHYMSGKGDNIKRWLIDLEQN